ncbi:ATP-binding protein [Sorangium sp. So ce394]|uniref:ATP-binding protein n=1 Tax=Sorangium sp. So ce394 TaxID=3133310 RepID=UPI003F5C5F09
MTADAPSSQGSSESLLRQELRRIDRLLAAAGRAVDPAARLDAAIAALEAEPARSASPPLDDAPVVLPGLARMIKTYGLSAFDRDLLLLVASTEIDGRYAEILRLLAGTAAPPLGLLVDLLIRGHGLPRDAALSRTADDAPLFRQALLRRGPGETAHADRPVTVPDPVWRRIVGIDGGCSFELVARHAIDDLVVAPSTRAAFDRAAAWAKQQAKGIVVVTGRPGSGRTAIAAALADALKRRALRVRPDDDVGAVLREARWFGAVPVVDGEPAAPNRLDLGRLVEAAGTVIAIGSGSGIDGDLPILDLEVAMLARAERRTLWRRALPPASQVDLERVVDRRLGPGRLLAAARRAREIAAASGSLSIDDVQAACRLAGSEAVGAGADRVEPRFSMRDLVIPPATRRELELAIAWGRQLEELASRGGPHLAGGCGLSCLFWGPAGTGKTTAAQVVASELGLDLYRVDLSRVIDKYIGETEKHLARIFDQAELHNFVLFFDEADALFSRRTDVHDAHDRFANVETSYLLQRLEQHRGITVLATNLRNNLDPAFVRRLHVVAEFPLPAVEERRALWTRLVPERRAGDVDVELLAGRFALSGGDIRNAVLAALVLAGDEPVAMRHLVIGVWREQARSGRLLSGNELGPWQREVAGWLGRGAP